MERPSAAASAWMGVGIGIGAYELICPPEQTLTEGFRRGMETKLGRVVLSTTAIIITGHLTGVLPEKIDPFEQGLSRIRRKVMVMRGIIQEIEEAM